MIASSRVSKLLAFVLISGLLAACESRPKSLEDSTPEELAELHPKYAGWCHGHDLPEAYCTECHPELVDKYKAEGNWCEEHQFPESACPVCNPMPSPDQAEAAQAETGDSTDDAPTPDFVIEGLEEGIQIRLRKPEHESAVGIRTEAVREAPLGESIDAPARIEFDRNRYADVRAPVPGIVRETSADQGDRVDKGAPLFVLESARIGDVQAKIRAARQDVETARANLDRQKKLVEKGLSARRKLQEARRDFETVRSQLDSLESTLRLAGGAGTTSTGRYTLRAPIAGDVVSRSGVVGTFATEETSLATVVDTSKMWAILDVAERDSIALRIGLDVILRLDDESDRRFDGQITWISPEVDSRTRRVKVRAEVENPDGQLRANQYAQATVETDPGKPGFIVPREAIQRYNNGSVVFVRKVKSVYEPRAVKLGRSDADRVQVQGDLKVGDEVVTTGAFILKTELNRDSIGAGCCEVPED